MGFLRQTEDGADTEYSNPLVWQLVIRLGAIPLALLFFIAKDPVVDAWNGVFAKCVNVLPAAQLAAHSGVADWHRGYTYSGSYTCTVEWLGSPSGSVWVDFDRAGGTTQEVWRDRLRNAHAVPALENSWEGTEGDSTTVLVLARPAGTVRLKLDTVTFTPERRTQLYAELAAQLPTIDGWMAGH